MEQSPVAKKDGDGGKDVTEVLYSPFLFFD